MSCANAEISRQSGGGSFCYEGLRGYVAVLLQSQAIKAPSETQRTNRHTPAKQEQNTEGWGLVEYNRLDKNTGGKC